MYPLLYETKSRDILLVQINPKESDKLPDSASEIMDRMNEVTFNAGLLAELRAIEFVVRMLEQKRLDSDRYKHVLMHRIDGGEVLKPFGASSKARADITLVRELFSLGRERARNGCTATASISVCGRRCDSTTIWSDPLRRFAPSQGRQPLLRSGPCWPSLAWIAPGSQG